MLNHFDHDEFKTLLNMPLKDILHIHSLYRP